MILPEARSPEGQNPAVSFLLTAQLVDENFLSASVSSSVKCSRLVGVRKRQHYAGGSGVLGGSQLKSGAGTQVGPPSSFPPSGPGSRATSHLPPPSLVFPWAGFAPCSTLEAQVFLNSSLLRGQSPRDTLRGLGQEPLTGFQAIPALLMVFPSKKEGMLIKENQPFLSSSSRRDPLKLGQSPAHLSEPLWVCISEPVLPVRPAGHFTAHPRLVRPLVRYGGLGGLEAEEVMCSLTSGHCFTLTAQG